MTIVMSTPDVAGLTETIEAMRAWQYSGGPVQLHPGDLGWRWRFGGEETAAAVRIWRRDDLIVAAGLVDSPRVFRLAMAPGVTDDEALAEQMVADLATPERGILPAGEAAVEARGDGVIRALLAAAGWVEGDPWASLVRDLAEPVEASGLRIEVTTPDSASVRTAVQRAAFDNSTFTDERWATMASGPAYADARCLVGYDDEGTAVAAATVWSAGEGRPGLLEPVGVHRDHRGHGYGTAISVAAAAALRELGASSATVATASANERAVATYRSAGFAQLPDSPDLVRTA